MWYIIYTLHNKPSQGEFMAEEKTVWEVNFEDSAPTVVFNKNQRQVPKIVIELEKPLGPCHLSVSEKL